MKIKFPVVIWLLLAPGIVSAQKKPLTDNHEYDLGSDRVTSNVSLNEINPGAFKHFAVNYATVKNAVWTQTTLGFAVSGTEESTAFRYRVCYNHHGAFQYALKFYPGAYATKELRKLIDIYFSGYSILNVIELNAENKTIIGLNIIRDTDQLAIEVHETEIKVVQEFENSALNRMLEEDRINHPGNGL